MDSLKLTTCSVCQGSGQAASGLACSVCGGAGSYLVDSEQHVYSYTIPLHLHHHEGLRQKQIIRSIVLALSIAGLLFSLVSLVGHDASFEGLFWQRSWVNALFALSGLILCYSLTLLQTTKAGKNNLHNLAELSKNVTEPISLTQFATENIEEVLVAAQKVALTLGQTMVDESILLIALLTNSRIRSSIARLEYSATEIAEEIKFNYTQQHPPGKVSTTPSYAAAVRLRLQKAALIAITNNFPSIEIEDILLSFLNEENEFSALFKKFELNATEFLAVTTWYAHEEDRSTQWAFWLERGRSRPRGYMNRAWTALPTRYLDQYSVDLTAQAASGRVKSASTRGQEIEAILGILGRTEKSSLVLVGEEGVGKQTVLGAVALKMIEGEVPEILQDKRLVLLDLASLLAQPGEAEQSVQHMLEEVTQAGNVILAIPEVHLLVGNGGALDAASVMASALHNGQIQVISTATYGDYHRYVESNPSLAAILDRVEIKEVTPEQAIEILEEETPQLEAKQSVTITYPAIKAAATLAKRYIADQYLPDNAISLLDQTASAVHLRKQSWVTKAEVEATLEQKLGVPVRQADEQQSSRLLNMEGELHKRLVGQEEAVKAVAEAIRRSAAGLHDGKRPVSSFLFVGPTGVGKTEMAKALTDLYFGNANLMTRLDMSEYQDGRAIYKLIGAPAGSSDEHTEGGALTQPVREHPHSLILLDEIEKAHPDVLNLFLQLLDDGRLTENTGRTVSYSNCIIIATSNAGSQELLELIKSTTQDTQSLDKAALDLLQKYFKPEFLNRFDRIVPFHPLTLPEVEQVTAMMLQGTIAKMAEQKYTITFAPETITKLAQLGYDPAFGARPLRRVIQDKVEALLATKILQREITSGGSLQITPEMIQ